MLLSIELNKYIDVLDKRVQEKETKISGAAARKARRLGSPSKSQAPYDAPAWALKNHTSTGTHHCTFLYNVYYSRCTTRDGYLTLRNNMI